MITQDQQQKKEAPKKETPKKQSLRYQRDKDREMVRGIFRFYEVRGGQMSFVFRKYKEDPVERYDLIDGETYTLPLGVAKHLNKNGWYPRHQYFSNEKGTAMRIGEKIRRFAFQSLEFVDVDDITPEGKPLITVEHV